MEQVNHMLIVALQMFKIDCNDSSHIIKFKSLFFVGFETTLLENIRINVINDLWSSE